jgi:hypothetical protein
MEYTSFSYLAPPRAEAKIPVAMLSIYEEGGWLAQIKKNGTNSVIFVPPDRKPFAYNRHGERHKVWDFDKESALFFSKLPGHNWYVFNAELLHSKVSGGPRNTNYLHDVLVYDGTYLVGRTYRERQNLLYTALDRYVTEQTFSHFILNPQTLLAKSFGVNAGMLEGGKFKAIFKEKLISDEDEGLVLKDPQGLLGTTDGKNARWMAKIRKPNKNLGF